MGQAPSSKLSISLLVFVCFALYATTFGNDFVLDDAQAIVKHKFVQQGVTALPEIFSNSIWQPDDKSVDINSYRPLTQAVFAIEHEFFGNSPVGYHVMQLLYYTLLCLSVLMLLTRLVGAKHPWLPLLASLLFAAHPIHCEIVNNLKSSDEIFALLNTIIAWILLYKFLDQSKRRYIIAATIFYFLGLLSKETPVTFLAIFPLSLYFFPAGSSRDKIIGCSALFSASLLFFFIRYLILIDFPGFPSQYLYLNNPMHLAEDFSTAAGMRLYAIGKALQLLAFPYELTSSYFYNDFPFVKIFDWRSLMSIALNLSLLSLCIKYFKRRSIIIFGIVYFYVTFSLFTNIIVMHDAFGERWLITPSLGFCIVAGALLCYFGDKFKSKSVALLSLALILSLYGLKVIDRNPAWKSNLTLATTDLETSPNSYMLNAMMALALFDSEDPDKLNDSIPYFEKALELNPARYEAWFQYGRVHLRQNQQYKAKECFKKALELVPGYHNAAIYLGQTYNLLGEHQNAVDTMAALTDLSFSNPDKSLMLFNELSKAHAKLSQNEEAANSLLRAIPSAIKAGRTAILAPLYHNIAVQFQKASKLDLAIENYRKALVQDPSLINAQQGLCNVYRLQGKPELAAPYCI